MNNSHPAAWNRARDPTSENADNCVNEEAPLLVGLVPETGSLPVVLVLGTFPSAASRREGAYYANPRNQFWPIVEALFGISQILPYPERIRALNARGVALWDTVAACYQEGSMDKTIRRPHLNDIADYLQANPTIRRIAVNGRTAERFLNDSIRDRPLPNGVEVVILPSTSPAHARVRLDEKTRCWSVIRHDP